MPCRTTSTDWNKLHHAGRKATLTRVRACLCGALNQINLQLPRSSLPPAQAARYFIGEPVWTPLNRPQEGHPARQQYVQEVGSTAVAAC